MICPIRYLATLVLLSAISPVINALEIEECDIWQLKANQFMTIRQQGTPIAQAMEEATGNKSRGLLLRAYTTPVAEGFEEKANASVNFSKEIYDECVAGDN